MSALIFVAGIAVLCLGLFFSDVLAGLSATGLAFGVIVTLGLALFACLRTAHQSGLGRRLPTRPRVK